MKKHISINTSKRHQKVLSVAIVSMFLSACGGGGGSNGTVPTTLTSSAAPTLFTNWSAVTNDSTVVVPGMSQEVSWERATAGGLTTSITTPTAVTTASAFTQTLDKSGKITKVVITSQTGNVTFDTAAGATITPGATIVAKNDSAGILAIAADPVASGWSYQSFGVWETGRATGNGNLGAISIGAPTAGGAIPTLGTATYTGKSIGFYTDSTGQGHETYSDLSVNANFATRTLALSTTSTVATTPAIPDASFLNLTGTLTYAAGANSFAGNVTTSGGNPTTNGVTLSGTSSGRFYGPSAEELGGVFILKGTGVETYGGAYGAERGAIAP